MLKAGGVFAVQLRPSSGTVSAGVTVGITANLRMRTIQAGEAAAALRGPTFRPCFFIFRVL